MKIKKYVFGIISLICPIIGLILYFIFKKDNESKKSIVSGSIIGLCIYSCLLLYLSTHQIDYFDRSIDSWEKDVKSGNTVVTVFAASFCEHCHEYRPVIKGLADQNHINLYFYEIDTLPEEDQKRLEETFPIQNYTGSVPYTFIMDGGQFVDSYVGYSNESAIRNFLLQYGIIKN